jgi:predicted dehydrogenase
LTIFRTGEEPEVLVPEGGDGYQSELEAFADACSSGEVPPVCPPEDSKAAVELTLAALKSRQQAGRVVHV